MAYKTRAIPDEAIRARFGGLPLTTAGCQIASAAALALFSQHAYGLPSAGDFLIQMEDEGISRPLVDIDEITAAFRGTRAGNSLAERELSVESAHAIEEALASGSAKPRINVTRLPEAGS